MMISCVREDIDLVRCKTCPIASMNYRGAFGLTFDGLCEKRIQVGATNNGNR